MAEIVSSAVTQEAVHQVLDKLKERYEHNSDAKDRMERMEMAHVRLEAALEASCQWSVTSAPLLRWRSKLKRAAQECDHTLRRCRRRSQEEEGEKRRRAAAGSPSLLTRVSRAATSFISSISGSGDDDDKVLLRSWGSASLIPRAVYTSLDEVDGRGCEDQAYSAAKSGLALREIMLPKAVDCLRKDVAATSYQALWKSKHGRAYLQVEKTSWRSTAPINEGARQGKKIKAWKSGISEFISSWIVHTPAELQASAVDWMQKQRRSPLPLIWKRKTTSCIHDCPFRPLSLQDFKSLASKIKSRSAFHALRA
ncbi:hypothetical protein HU200_034502 [Digitaria exilis]|uniref:Uncharacterized protein n=1 Tax=Digitaria exilis TaxID=1010633 RepID=A0A835BPU5_9POAL|nr:hypothetical protein HU200_034502 [Digitaria exilis]CAB3491916.1 unnamed protein product [Digitaria exilis]